MSNRITLGNVAFWLCLVGASGGAFAVGFHYTHGATTNVTTKTPGTDVGSSRQAVAATATPAPTPTAAPTEAPGPLIEEAAPAAATPRPPAATPQPLAAAVEPAPVEATPAPERPRQEMYRVQVGPFSDREAADRQVQELQTAGINAVVIYDGGQYQAQIGAFSDRARAIAVADEVNVRGYSVTIRH